MMRGILILEIRQNHYGVQFQTGLPFSLGAVYKPRGQMMADRGGGGLIDHYT